ncbi:hypothetical protein [Cesiribacter sp. SM1]|uniref:hypothetical protein n=1 Tax=Cesiribacter sp. SM1 TaxID=2861196 RepID=UPI001CD3A5AF|nr:hypothetical protein [Cesiribacter sp. SM1]
MRNLIEKNARVIYDKELDCLYVHLIGFISYNDLVRVLQYEFQMVQYYKPDKCVVDLTAIKVYPSGGKEYIKDVWFPHMESNGMQYVACVVPDNPFGEASMQKAHEKAAEHKKLEVRHFRDIASAKAWVSYSMAGNV